MAFEDTNIVSGAETSSPVVVGVFANADDAQRAVAQLKENGFTSSQIGAAFRHRSTGSSRAQGGLVDDAAGSTGQYEQEGWWEKLKELFSPDTTSESRVDKSETLADSSLSKAPVRDDEYEYDYSTSEIEGSLAGTGIPADRAASLTRSLEPGGAIVTVRDVERAGEAEEILSSNKGQIRYEDMSGQQYGETPVAGRQTNTDLRTDTPGVTRVQLLGEVLRVHKERISSGEVRLRKEIITENKTIDVPVTREELVLERVAVPDNTPASSGTIGEQQDIRIPLSEERVRVDKQAVVREEVAVGKREISDVQKVGDSVRHEELRVDKDLTEGKQVTGEDYPDDERRQA